MDLITDAAGLAPYAGCTLVPTMGALHQGHVALIREAVRLLGPHRHRPPVLVTIFVNPTQFNDPADLARYPRTLESDLAACQNAGADAVFAPPPEVIYPPGQVIPTPPLPDVATKPGLEDARRPGHFAGVCQVVNRLFNLTRPSAAIFGEKDWQQLQVVSAMVRHQHLPLRILHGPTVRETDGLAMSSRNVFLSPENRRRALALSQALCTAQQCVTPPDAETHMVRALNAAGIHEVEYAVVRDAQTLMPLPAHHVKHAARALIATRLGPVRLIDNAPWPS